MFIRDWAGMPMDKLVLSLATLGSIVLVVHGTVESPIVIVPGLSGSQLQGKLNRTSVRHFYCSKVYDWYNMWLNLEELLPPADNCLVDNIRLFCDATTGRCHNQEGVSTRVPGFGNTTTIEYLDPDTPKWFTSTQYFNTLVEYFVKQGYVRGKTIRGAPYDWRFAANGFLEQGYYDDLKSLIEETYQLAGNKPVTLVVHSLGGPTSLFFLTKVVDQAWKDTYIKAYVTLSGAWRGAAKVMRTMTSGDNSDLTIDDPLEWRIAQRSFPSSPWLLPYPSDTWTPDDVIIITTNRNYTAWDYADFYNDVGYPEGYGMFQQLYNLTGPLPPPGVPTYCYYGADVQTPLQFQYAAGEFPDHPPTVAYGAGDGTVNDNSLMSCARWQGQQTYPVYLRAFSGVDHSSMVQNMEVIMAIQNITSSVTKTFG